MNNAATQIIETNEVIFPTAKALADKLNAMGFKPVNLEKISGVRATSASYMSGNSIKVLEVKHLGIEVWTTPCARIVKVFAGKKSKSNYYHSYNTPQRAEESLISFINRLQSNFELTQAEKQKTKESHTLQVGDVLRSSYGYNMTLINYYQVIELVSKSSVIVRELKQQKSGEGWSGKCAPVINEFIDEPVKMRVCAGNSIKFSSCQRAYKIEPKIIAGVKLYDASYYNTCD